MDKIKLENYLIRAKDIHKSKYDYSLITNAKNTVEKLDIICPIHGVFKQNITAHVTAKQGCPKCGNRFIKTTQEVKDEIYNIHKDKYKYVNFIYKNNKQKIDIICEKHGIFKQIIREHINGSGCPKCTKTFKKTTETFIDAVKQKFGDKYDYSKVDYIKNSIPVIIICKTHGEFQQTPHAHMAGYGCSRCVANSSKKENEWLDSLNINSLIKQAKKRINGKIYIVDGFDPQTNTVYQFHGSYFHGHPKYFKSYWTNRVSNKSFGELFNRTNEIKELFINSGYKYIEMWEHDYKTTINPFSRKIVDSGYYPPEIVKQVINSFKYADQEDFDINRFIPYIKDSNHIV